MEGLKRVQFDIQSKIEKGLRNFKKSPKERLTQTYVQARLESLENMWQLFVSTHNEILKTYEIEIVQEYFDKEVYDKTEDTFIEYKSALKFGLMTISASASASASSSSNEKVSSTQSGCFKLPKINIPIFSGRYAEWPTFRDLYVSLIHNNVNIDKVQKLHYLKGYLVGEAEQLLRQIPVSEDNYDRAWNLLINRYNNKKYLSGCILNRLLGQRDLTFENANGLKNFIDTSTDCMDALSNLGIDVSTWDVLIIHILSSKLDAETKKQWELHVSNNIGFDCLPTFEQFKTFISNRYRALEFVIPNRSKIVTTKPTSKVFHVNMLCCSFCGEEHKLRFCKKFCKCSVDERREFVLTKGLCFNCMGTNHSAKNCSVNIHCKICKRLHHTMLHPQGSGSGTDSGDKGTLSANVATENMEQPSTSGVANRDTSDVSDDPDDCEEPIISCFSKGKLSQVLLATALVHAEASNGNHIMIRALLDQGSQGSFITESAVQLLGLKKKRVKSKISGLGCDKNVTSSSLVKIKLCSRSDSRQIIEVDAYVLNAITSFLPSREVVSLGSLNLIGLVLADPGYHTPGKVDILLGAEVYGKVIQEGIRKDTDRNLLAQATIFGWIISGEIKAGLKSNNIRVMHSTFEDDLLKRFWELEKEPLMNKEKVWTEEEKECERIYKETTSRDEEGRYIVKIPFKVDKPEIEGSKEVAKKRFDLLEKRLNKNKELKIKFNEVMNEYILNGHMEIVPPDEINNHSVYVPTLAVIRNDRDSTKVRVVCDSSCKGKDGISINDTMMKGPVLQQELRHLLMRWRVHPVCLVADIAKMYLQIKVTKSDTDYQRLLWRPDDGSKIQSYRMLRVTFGTASAPYLAVRTLQQVAHDEGENYPMAKERAITDFYMDDLMTGCETVSEAVKIQKQMCELLLKGGFQIRKWTSNKDKVLEEIGQAMKDTESEKLYIKSDAILKILGITWDRRADEFQYAVEVMPLQEPVTKRKILSEISRLYDPLGWVSPCIVIAKTLIQKLWLKGLDWDEPVTEEICKEWVTYREDLPLLKDFHVSRWLGTTASCCVELHGFSDASKIAYAAVVFVRIIYLNGDIEVKFVTAKTKVAPIKMVAVPRLELCGAVLLAKLLAEVAEVLAIKKEKLFAWTDSTVVLAWINSYPRRWKPFIANRISDILNLLESSQWAYVASKENPADIASRGMFPKELLISRIWKQGPEFLKNRKINQPKNKFDTNEEEIKVHVVIENKNEEGLWTRFSSLRRMVRVLAYCRRFVNLLKTKKEKRAVESFLTSKELEESLMIIIKRCQEENFKEEIKELNERGVVKKNSKISTLNPFIDNMGILRVGGRLSQSSLSQDALHPILLPKTSIISFLIILDVHHRLLHGGQQLMLNFVRNKYWILGAKHLIKKIIHSCNKCIRYSNKMRNQLMGQLPMARVSPSRPFSQSGVDFAGPINIRTAKGRGHHAYKGYICLFICMATRAIHLEVVSDLTANGFLAAFRRFVARRGHCAQLWSDNGKNFIGSSRELQQLFASEQSRILSDIREALANNQTTWHFIPPYAPNFGGLWEAGIKSTKFHLKRTIGDSTLTYEELSTVLIQIEACLNSRPLSRIDSDGGNYSILTPGHFIIGEPLVTVPDKNYEDHNISSLKRWQLTQRMLQTFWSRWSQEYLHQFLQRHKWTEQIPVPKTGDIVLVKELDLPPARWVIGQVIETHPGVDGIVRVVTLRAKNSTFKRPVSKLCLLPAAN